MVWLAFFNFNWIEEEAGSMKGIHLFVAASYASQNVFLYRGFGKRTPARRVSSKS